MGNGRRSHSAGAELYHICLLQLAFAPTPPSESGMQLTLNSAQVHPAQLATDHRQCETFCPSQKHGLACNWSPVTHPAQQLCSTASWRCPLSTWIYVACTALTITPLLFMFCFLTGKVLEGQLQIQKSMYSISMSVITWRPLCLLPAKDKAHSGK